ncbi:NLP/P60 protein OS=Tsukamurella paurometabola (strain ATCC 8368 / DSM / CCUG 35730 / CIP 100753/ JCM 10117 / KCTC 9821 / NBRC 16120 / NCIMB 702349 / NCTC 13040) OX=521096 GN=Tpau_2684 PE=3 SV=1 [Tsukamurella paurometabola]|uniref:NLP/P60 protein n=1 Tax=Tsukamurella paurometabola (strain ATCC 8368 / DSM 20162 / CCUG 35730 / CIP 100753 / JCM 10117 / KCTC 9821 / NBRC 16120 / NCIMB 702349 / NCTC 13040) TaxID=521096 RepID=D5USL3_TSUPD|nr:C40 family peptidase [Tsukamurella paurometabola]ADG79284.1 NLP/P60 protein [Tsukamurella paurometabola DSM 20162]SUP34912.1 Probable endopeptidase cgR_2070 precursor [Tsukamurella paurometabola]
MAKHRLQPQPSKGATAARGALAAGAVTIGTLAAPAATALAAPAPAVPGAPAPAPLAPGAPAPAVTAKPAVKAKPAAKPAPKAVPGAATQHNVAARPGVVTGVQIAPKPGTTTVAGVQPGGAKAKVVQAALSRTGLPYSYGSAGPNSFDCSGLVYWSMKQAGMNVPRDSYGQLGGGRPVPVSDLQPGDVVIYNGGSHAALYIGSGKVVHSVNYGTPVKVSPLNEMSVYAVRRY